MPQAGSVDARSAAPGSLAQDTPAGLPPHWWAAGLTLAERLRLSGQPARPAEDERLERARRRLERWRGSPGLGKDGHFARLLDERGLDVDRLLALLAEDPGDLADRAAPTTDRPAWAETVEAVLRAMPAESAIHPEEIPPPDEESAWQVGFLKIVSPFLRVAVGRFVVAAVRADGLDDLVDVHQLSHQLATQLGQQLTTLAGRTLVLELNVLRVTDRLRGETARERFWSFVEHFSTRDALVGLMSEYVVLARLLAQACDQAVEAYHELLVRLAEDRAEIVTSVLGGEDPGRLVEVHMGGGIGDLHQGGRAVGLLRFAGGARLVYKPRPLAVHRHVNDVIRWLDERLPGYGLRSLVVVDRGRYGWVEFVEHSPCENVDGARLFYRRQGALLALLYALDGADFHYENLIANGDQPVLVDLEAVFHPRVPRPSGLDWMNGDPAVSVLAESVSRIGLLPSVLWSEDGDAIDMGGVGGDAGQPLPFKVVGWGGSGTDEMHLTRENILFPGSQNRPSVDGHVVNPAHFVSELTSGFRDGYEAIVSNRSELVGPGGLLERFANDEIRVVMRATRLYGTLLVESTHPDVLRDALDRERVFDFLWGFAADDPIRRPLVPVESEELWSGDVPMFTTRPATRDLWNGRGVRMPGVLDHDSLTHAMDKVRAMGARDRAQQEWIIEASMATRPDQAALVGAGPFPVEPAVSPSPAALDHERVLAAVRGIADQVAAIAHADGSRVNWLGIDLIQESQWMVNPLRLDLYSGIPGVALFLAQAASVLGDDRYADLARRALTPLPEIVDSVVNAPAGTPMTTCGPFSGYGGLAYALTHLTRELGDPSLGDAIEPLVTSLTESIPIDEMFDVIGGAAGALGVLLAVHEATGLPVALRLARACADRLVETARPQRRGVAWPGAISSSLPLTGFSHGGAGIGWALARFAATPDGATAGARYAETARAAFAYERDLYDPHVRNWPDYRDIPGERADDTPPASMQAWCHGAPGIGLARADLLRRGVTGGLAADARALTADLDLALASFLASPTALGGHSLCHGELGNLELVTTMIAAGRTDLVEARDRRLGVVLDQLESGPRCGTPAGVPTPGLMSGLAGIGHGLLRHAFPDRVPSVLLLEPPIG
ncbi:type 2 lanthipeptide synthetase LanM family protein [Streptosporangium sp. 'caverna']|uniref:type 2 lanthipeptide synthetase LanM family protein n=1 Tax=Streptosporangium sp. 'caverna' TaxID=2202249 RepID=UPI0013A6BBE9|nr:type 2 lanthipeptide synthetase LanM family protein [Streptosporangium sp. 'caverna']